MQITAPKAQGVRMPEKEASDFTMMRVSKDLVKEIRIAAAYEQKSMVAWLDSIIREALKKGKKK